MNITLHVVIDGEIRMGEADTLRKKIEAILMLALTPADGSRPF